MNKDNVILGENVVYSTDCAQTGLNNNVIVCGSSGCGKTMSITEPRLLETKNGSLVVNVTKRRIVTKYKRMFEKRGYAVHDLNFSNPTESDVSYDPLRYIKSYADISFLAKSIVNANPRKEKTTADPYWDDAAVSLLSAEIAYVYTTMQHATFADVLALHDTIEMKDGYDHMKTSIDAKFAALAQKDPNCFAVTCWRTFNKVPKKTASCIFSVLNAALDAIFSPELRKMIGSKKSVDFKKIASNRTVLFVSTSAVNTALHGFVNIFYAQVFKSLFEYAESLPDATLPLPVHVLCDDFATGSRILNFPEYIAIFREKQISVTLLVQSESQLERMYGHDDAVTIINNCDTYLYMGGMDLKTGHSISERLNAPLEDILYMPIGQVCIFRRGQRPIVTKRYDICKDVQYQRLARIEGKRSKSAER